MPDMPADEMPIGLWRSARGGIGPSEVLQGHWCRSECRESGQAGEERPGIEKWRNGLQSSLVSKKSSP